MAAPPFVTMVSTCPAGLPQNEHVGDAGGVGAPFNKP
jgi:hypothetical protein